MEKKHKCNYCDALLSETNSVFIHISRFDDRCKSSRSLWMCCNCWDKVKLPDPDNRDSTYNRCGNCRYLIFKDYKEQTGSCRLTRLYRRFEDLCVHDEEIM